MTMIHGNSGTTTVKRKEGTIVHGLQFCSDHRWTFSFSQVKEKAHAFILKHFIASVFDLLVWIQACKFVQNIKCCYQ